MNKLLSLLCLLGISVSAHSQNFELRLRAAGGSLVAVEMREISGLAAPGTSDILADLVFGICWDKTYGIDLGAVNSNYTIRKAGSEGIEGNLEYQQFAKDPNPLHFPTAWANGEWVQIMTVSNNVAATQTYGVFSVCPLPVQELNINYNLTDFKVVAGEAATGVRIGIQEPNRPNHGVATSIPELLTERPDWNLTPNPSMGHFVIALQALREEEAQITVVDAAGKTVFSDIMGVRAGENSLPVQLDTAASGMHQISLRWPDGQVQTKNLMISNK
jgi:hypothetical protein